jgi:putative holliday junction resolvase
MKILGIDYGSKRIGIAISDEGMTMAFPKVVLLNDKNLFDNLEGLIKTEEISQIVLGESKDFKMKDNPIMEKIRGFKKELEEKFDLEVIFHPEFMSSHQAAKMSPAFLEASTWQRANKMLDASAATIILQSYLDMK